MTHPYPIHGVAYAWTGTPQIDVGMELRPNDPKHWPFFSSVVDYVDRQSSSGQISEIPSNIALPFKFSSQREGEVPRAGPYAAFLGNQYNPVWTDFVGTATNGITKTLGDKTYSDNDPYVGTTTDSHFIVPSADGATAGHYSGSVEPSPVLALPIQHFAPAIGTHGRGAELEPLSANGCVAFVVGQTSRGTRYSARTVSHARVLRSYAVWTVMPGSAAYDRGGKSRRQRVLGMSMDWPAAVGIRIGIITSG